MDQLPLNILISNLNTSITKYGKIRFSEIGEKIESNYENLITRQTIIKNMISNISVVEKMIKLLATVNQYETDIYSYFEEIPPFEPLQHLHSLLITCKYYFSLYSPLIIVITILYLINDKYHTKYICLFLIYIYTLLYDSSNVYRRQCEDTSEKVTKICELVSLVKEIYDTDIFIVDKRDIDDDLELLVNSFDKKRTIGYLIGLKYKSQSFSDPITSILKYVGLLDAYITISTLVLENKCVLPIYEQSKSKYIYGENVYNPLIEDCVANDIYIGAPNIISLTGRHGKTILCHTIGLNTIFAQTYGIVFCLPNSKFVISPVTDVIMAIPEKLKSTGVLYICDYQIDSKIVNNMIKSESNLFIVTNNYELCELKSLYENKIMNKKMNDEFKIRDGVFKQ